jgi:hypothetical protein
MPTATGKRKFHQMWPSHDQSSWKNQLAGSNAHSGHQNIPSNEECGIRDVWAHNLHEEFKTIRKVVQKFHCVAMVKYF